MALMTQWCRHVSVWNTDDCAQGGNRQEIYPIQSARMVARTFRWKNAGRFSIVLAVGLAAEEGMPTGSLTNAKCSACGGVTGAPGMACS